MPAIPKRTIHSRILVAVQSAIEEYKSIDEIPFRIRITSLGEFAFYAFTLTSPPGGRPLGEYKIQLIIPGQSRGDRGHLELAAGTFTIVMGWSQDLDLFVLWDAYAHQSFAYSQNLQIKGDTVFLARTIGLVTTERRLRGGRGTEIVVVCRPDQLLKGIRERIHFSAQRLSHEVT